MAEALVNHEARARGLSLRAASAGTVQGAGLNQDAVQTMEEIGVPMVGQSPKLLTQEMADSADLIISMGCEVDADACPARFLVSEDWGLDDPAGQPIEKVREIRDEIRRRVESMLEEIERS